jgi:osmotically-inducible protein OsmY
VLFVPSLSVKRDEARSHGSTSTRGTKVAEEGEERMVTNTDLPPDASDIRTTIKEYLMSSRHLSFGAKRVKVDVSGTVVKMSGKVKSNEELVVVERVALATDGVSAVDTSQITVQ